MLNDPFPLWPYYSLEERNAVGDVLLSNKVNYWTGQECRQFEKEFASFTGVEHAIAVTNGTLALDLALKCLGVGSGDEVVVTPRTFLASASCIVTAGATPVFADVDPESQNITAESIRAVLSPRTKAIICVHLAGWPCDMDPIMDLAKERGLVVLEDCAQAHGARYKGRSVGSIGHVGAWSFCQDKIMTTGGEGGMVTTNDRELWARMWSYKDHGKSWEAVYEREHPPGFRWVHESFGTNWRMMEVQAAIGRIQLQRMTEWNRIRARNAAQLKNALSAFEFIRLPWPPENVQHAWYKFYAFVIPELLPAHIDRDQIIARINQAGVPCTQGSCPEVYLERAFDNTGFRPRERLPVARMLGETSMMFLVHPTIDEDRIKHLCHLIHSTLSALIR